MSKGYNIYNTSGYSGPTNDSYNACRLYLLLKKFLSYTGYPEDISHLIYLGSSIKEASSLHSSTCDNDNASTER